MMNLSLKVKAFSFLSVDYDVEVEESGTYTTVTGEKTKGSVKFVVESAEDLLK